MFMVVQAYASHSMYVTSEDNSQESVLSFHHVVLGIELGSSGLVASATVWYRYECVSVLPECAHVDQMKT